MFLYNISPCLTLTLLKLEISNQMDASCDMGHHSTDYNDLAITDGDKKVVSATEVLKVS